MPVGARGYDYCPILIWSCSPFYRPRKVKQVPQELTDQTTPIEAQHSTIEHNFFLVFSLRRLRNKVKNHSLVVASYDMGGRHHQKYEDVK